MHGFVALTTPILMFLYPNKEVWLQIGSLKVFSDFQFPFCHSISSYAITS